MHLNFCPALMPQEETYTHHRRHSRLGHRLDNHANLTQLPQALVCIFPVSDRTTNVN